jgi:hypothetical protein
MITYGTMTVTVVTPSCPSCGEASEMDLCYGDYRAWQGGMLIQDAFPEMTADDRETLLSGFHPVCWDSLWSDED